MAKLIIVSTVGTSIYTNYRSTGALNDEWLNLSDNTKSASEYNSGEVDYSKVELEIQEFFFKDYVKTDNEFKKKGDDINYDCCAEVKTIKKIIELKSVEKIEKKKPKDLDEIELHLLHSDTAIGKSSALLVKSFFETYKSAQKQTIHIHLVESLNTNSEDGYKNGVNNLIAQIHNVPYGRLAEFIINISGGFKGFIPYLTIYSQLFKKSMYYIYEDSTKLVEIPPLDLTFDFNSMINIYPYLCEGKISSTHELLKSNETYSNFFLKENKNKLPEDSQGKDEAELQVNPLGKIVQFKMEDSLFRESDEAISYLLKQLNKENEKEQFTKLPIVVSNIQYDIQPLSFLYLFSKNHVNIKNFEDRYTKEHKLVLYIWYPIGLDESIAKRKMQETENFINKMGYTNLTIELVQKTIKY